MKLKSHHSREEEFKLPFSSSEAVPEIVSSFFMGLSRFKIVSHTEKNVKKFLSDPVVSFIGRFTFYTSLHVLV